MLARRNDAAEHLRQHVQTHLASIVKPGQTLLLAYSGGLDSRVLLELLTGLRATLGFTLHAMHIHHGLSSNADHWTEFCKASCTALAVPLTVVRVTLPENSGLGIEAAAREARYIALMEAGADYVVLAHHENDQAETLLLQLLRGAGAKGLSGMAVYDANRCLLRPLLDIPRAQLLAYAQAAGLQWIEDESNADEAYDRNYCRHQILPVMQQRFPAATHTLARSAAHLAEAASLLDVLAEVDSGQYSQGQQLDVTGLANLPEPRARNLLRWWLSRRGLAMPNSVRLQEMLRQLLSARADTGLKIAADSANGIWLRRHRGLAYLEHEASAAPIAMLWQGEDELVLPDGSRLLFTRQVGAGLAIDRLGIKKLRISQRLGGERFKPDLNKPTRTLKHLLQEANMPPWLRDRLPLIYSDDVLAIVPGIGVSCCLQAGENETGLVVTWQQT